MGGNGSKLGSSGELGVQIVGEILGTDCEYRQLVQTAGLDRGSTMLENINSG